LPPVVSATREIASAAGEKVIPTAYASDEADDIAKGVIAGLNTAAVGIATAVCPPAGAALGCAENVASTIMSDFDDKDAKEVGQILSVTSAIGGGTGGIGAGVAKKGASEVAKTAGEAAVKGAAQS